MKEAQTNNDIAAAPSNQPFFNKEGTTAMRAEGEAPFFQLSEREIASLTQAAKVEDKVQQEIKMPTPPIKIEEKIPVEEVEVAGEAPALETEEVAAEAAPETVDAEAKVKPKAAAKEKKAAKAGGKKAPLSSVGSYLRTKASPAMQAGKAGIAKLAENQKDKKDATKKKEEAEKSAIAPAKEGESLANAEQAATVDAKEAPTTDEQKAKEDLNSTLQAALPTKVEEVDTFKSDNKTEGIVNAVKNVVDGDIDKVVTTYQDVKTPPPPKPVAVAETMPDLEIAPPTPNLSLAPSIVQDLQPEHTDLSNFATESDDLVAKEGITDEHLNLVDSGDLYEAKVSRDGLKTDVANAPADVNAVRTTEIETLETELTSEEEEARKEMSEDREKELGNARADQETAKTDIELKRQAVTDHINSIYETAKTTVDEKLAKLETDSLEAFDKGQAIAATAFEDNVNRRMEAFKKDRYGDGLADSLAKTASGVANFLSFGLIGEDGGATAWLGDKLLGLDRLPAVKQIFDEEREAFVTEIDRLIVEITAQNTLVIEECRTIVADARIEIDEFISTLDDDLKATGEQAFGDISAKLDDLDNQINEKEEELKKQLEDKKEAAIEAIDKKIEEMKADMGGLLAALGNLLLNAALKFFEWALTSVGLDPSNLMNIINKGVETIKAIVSDPINFLSNLIDAVKGGFDQFQANIKENIMEGLIGWLTGQMGDLNITLPETWDLKGVIGLVMQVLGLSWSFVRGKLVKYLGPEIVEAAETTFEVVKTVVTDGPMGLWEMLKDKVAEIQATIISGIRDWAVTAIIKNGIIKILSLFNPAGAIVQAIKMVYDVIMFFVENGSRIVELLSSVTDSIANIAAGNIGTAIGKVSDTLKQTIPIMISFLARLLGLSGVSAAIKNVIQKVTKPLHNAIDKAVKWMVDKVREWWDKLKKKLGIGKKDEKKDDAPDNRTAVEKQKDLDAAFVEVKAIDNDPKTTKADLDEELPLIKSKYRLKRLEAVPVEGDEQNYDVKGELNPTGSTPVSISSSAVPKTVVHYPGGGVAYADPLTSNRTIGTKPKNIPGWTHAQLLNKQANIWRKGHMVSQELGGLGELKNMSIISQSINSKMASGPEQFAKDQTKAGNILVYKTTWENHPTAGPIENFAESVIVDITVKDSTGKIIDSKNYPYERLPAPPASTSSVILSLNESGEGMISRHFGVDLLFAREINLAKNGLDYENITDLETRMDSYYTSKGFASDSEKVLKMDRMIDQMKATMNASGGNLTF